MLTRALFGLLLICGTAAAACAEDAKVKALGITQHEVSQAELEKGEPLPVPRFNTAAIAYAWVANLKKGDTVEIALVNGDKSLLHNTETLEEDQAGYLLQAGKRGVPAGGWPEGTYHAALTVTRDGKTLIEKQSEPMTFAQVLLHRRGLGFVTNVAALLPLFLSAGVTAAGQKSLAMQTDGKGPVVVLESGMGEARANWRAVVDTLAPCFTVVSYDRYGIGESPAAADSNVPVLASTVADALLAQLRARGLSGPFILVGHSLGGLYVQAFARNYPQAVAGLVLVDATSPIEPEGEFVSTIPPKPGTIEAAEEAGAAPSIVDLRDGSELPPIPLVVIVATDHDDTAEREALWQQVQKDTATLSPKGRLVVVESGHYVQKDRPDVVADAVIDVAAEIGIDAGACRQ